MIRTFLYLDLKPGRRDALISWYKQSGALEKAVEYANCISTEIYPDSEDDDRLFVTALWARAEDYDSWINNPWRRSTSEEISEFLKDGFTPESRGEVVQSLHQAPVRQY